MTVRLLKSWSDINIHVVSFASLLQNEKDHGTPLSLDNSSDLVQGGRQETD